MYLMYFIIQYGVFLFSRKESLGAIYLVPKAIFETSQFPLKIYAKEGCFLDLKYHKKNSVIFQDGTEC